MNKVLFRSLLLLTSLAAAPRAQSGDGSYWSEYPRPAGVTNVRGLGSQVLLETPTALHFFSGQHRRWLVHPVSNAVILGFANKHCVFQDGTTVYGYSSFTSKVVPLPTSGSAVVSIGNASSSWTAYVVDGTTVHAWSAFFGEWKPLAVVGAPVVGIGSHMVTCNDGGNAHAFSAFFGDWVACPRTGAGGVTTWRNGAFADFAAPDQLAAFSAYTNTWATAAAPSSAGAAIDARDAYASATWNGGNDRLWFSALRGTFTASSFPGGQTTQFAPSVAVVTAANGDVHGYSPSQSSLTQIPTAQPAAVSLSQGSFGACAVIDDGVTLQAFSGLTGTVASTPFWVPTTLTLGDTAVFATDATGIGFAYSGIRGQWVLAPNTVASAIVANFECILRTVPGGYEAFSARTGTFAPLVSTGSVTMLTQGSIMGVVDGTGVDVFDARYGRWVRQSTAGMPTFGVHRLVGVAREGNTAYGFGMWQHAFDSITLQGTYSSQNVNSSIAIVQTSSHVYVYTATGSMNTFARFPEFSRFHALGQPLSRNNTGNPGAFVVALLALSETEAATPFGVLRIDPNPLAIALGFVPADGRLYSPLATPDVPALRGITLFMQDFMLRPNGQFALSNGLAHYLW
ncbi:MAG: hypothetical protein MUC36_11460 [Planctomycetes bacterium]|jgi:hypothetical protein|nr:hypothetical protein [Planctomycetota bacterium]